MEIVLLILIFIITIGCSIVFISFFERSMISPLSIIPFFSFFYISGWIFHIMSINKYLTYNDIYLISIALLFVLSFFIGGLGRKKYKITSRVNYSLIRIKLTGYILLILSLFLFYYIYTKYGVEFYILGKGYRNLLYNQMGIEKLAKPLMVIAIVIINFYYTKINNTKSIFYIVSVLLGTILFIFLEVRSGLAIIIISYIYFYDRHIKKINNFKIFLLLITLLFLGSIAKEFFYNLRIYSAEGVFQPDFFKAFNSVFIQHEFYAWFEIFQNTQNIFVGGETFYKSIFSLLYPRFLGGEGFSLTTWYVEHYTTGLAEKGIGRGFSFLVELYINFKIVGVLIFGFLFGKFLKLVEDGKHYYLAMFFSALFPFVWTGNSAVFLKQTFMIYYILPIIIYILLKVITRGKYETIIYN